jgi:hypothetical protein
MRIRLRVDVSPSLPAGSEGKAFEELRSFPLRPEGARVFRARFPVDGGQLVVLVYDTEFDEIS